MEDNRLFDVTEVTADPRMAIPARLGQVAGRFIDRPHLIRLEFERPGTDVFIPTEEDAAYISDDYAQGSAFEADFRYWERAGDKYERSYQGYLAGFPVLAGPDGERVHAVHVWSVNSSVFDETLAFPLTAIESMVAETKLRNKLRLELEEVQLEGTSQRYQVPQLLDVVKNEMMYRPAKPQDLERVIAQTPGSPLRVFGGVLLDSMFGRTAVEPTEEELLDLLNRD